MEVIGHRGAAGLALENTIDGFEIAKLLGVDSIELDVHMTKDGHIVVIHDGDLKRITNSASTLSVKNSTLKQLQAVTLRDGHSRIPTLSVVLKMTDTIPIIIEVKSEGCGEALIKILQDHPKRSIAIASFKHAELARIRKLDPELIIYGSEKTKPFEIIQLARSLKLNGIALNYWLLNPLTYWSCKRYGLKMFVYTINSRFMFKILSRLYPDVGICTNYPEKFLNKSYLLDEHSSLVKRKI